VDNTVLVIGIGNEDRGDDGVGLVAIRALEEQGLQEVICKQSTGDGMALMDLWEGFNNVILIDAMLSGGTPGAICRFDANKEAIPARLSSHSTHAFGVADAIELAKTLYELPTSLIVYAIEGKDFPAGVGLTPEVEHAASVVVRLVTREVQRSR
jgi:hydrogenase maturation protease